MPEHSPSWLRFGDPLSSRGLGAGNPRRLPIEPHRLDLGLRPEAVLVANDEAGDQDRAAMPQTKARVGRLEYQGDSILACLVVGDATILSRMPASTPLQEGQQVSVLLDLSLASWFDAETGQRVDSFDPMDIASSTPSHGTRIARR